MNIAFNINKLALIGLGVTLNSLLKNCSDPQELNFYILCADLNSSGKKNISTLLLRYGITNGVFIDFNAKEHFGHLKCLQGDWTTYGRLLLQDFILDDSVLYLDADLVIEFDVLALKSFDFEGKALAAVNGGHIKFSLENVFFCNELGIKPELAAFNAGILLINLRFWRENDIKNQCLAFGSRYSNKLRAADQTILNALFAGNFTYLPSQFNVAWYAHANRPIKESAILHFVGSPKPWDLFGRYLHNGFVVWKNYLDSDWQKAYYKHNHRDFIRLCHLRRSYLKIFTLKIKSNFS
jgi:lipopolysaccharide biosynthesis glycosyltransferase